MKKGGSCRPFSFPQGTIARFRGFGSARHASREKETRCGVAEFFRDSFRDTRARLWFAQRVERQRSPTARFFLTDSFHACYKVATAFRSATPSDNPNVTISRATAAFADFRPKAAMAQAFCLCHLSGKGNPVNKSELVEVVAKSRGHIQGRLGESGGRGPGCDQGRAQERPVRHPGRLRHVQGGQARGAASGAIRRPARKSASRPRGYPSSALARH